MSKEHKHVCILQTSFAKKDDMIVYLKEHVPGVRVTFITDDTLLADVMAAGSPPPAVISRMTKYAMAAQEMGADVILNSCSSVGEVADVYMQVVDIPVVKIDQAMAEEAVRTGSNIALIATVPSTLAPSRRLIERVAAAQGKTISVREFLIENAYAQLKSGHPEVHNELVKAKIRELEGHYDCIVMAQVSMRALLPALSDVHTPILCSFYSGLQRTVDVLNSL